MFISSNNTNNTNNNFNNNFNKDVIIENFINWKSIFQNTFYQKTYSIKPIL